MKAKFTILITCLFFFIDLSAQPAPVLTLKTCIQRAQKYSYRLQANQQKTEAAKQFYQFDRSQTLPQFSGELSGEQRYLQPYSFHQQMAFIHAGWSLGNFILKTAAASRQDVRMVEAKEAQVRLEVSRRAALLFVSVLQYEAQRNLLQKRLELLETHHEVAEALWKAGSRTRLDVLQTESEIAQLKEQIAGLELERNSLLQELSRLISLLEMQSTQLQKIDTDQICNRPVPEIPSDYLQKNPMVLALSFQIRAQQIRTKNVTAQQLPQLSVAGGYFSDGDPTGDGNYWQANVGFNIPLFMWRATKYQRQESEARVGSLVAQKKQVEREIAIHANQALTKLKKLKQVLELQNIRLQTTKEAFQFAQVNYQAGLISNLDYLTAQQQFTETEIAIQETQLGYVMNLIEFYVTTKQVEKIENMK